MLLAAMSPAHRCSCNCPLQHRAVAKQLWQAGFIRAGQPLLGTLNKSKPVPLPWWTATALWLEQSPRALVPGSRAVEGRLKSAEQPQYPLRAPAFPFLLLGSLRFAACTGSITLMLSQTSSHSRKVLWVYVSMQSISDNFSFLLK